MLSNCSRPTASTQLEHSHLYKNIFFRNSAPFSYLHETLLY